MRAQGTRLDGEPLLTEDGREHEVEQSTERDHFQFHRAILSERLSYQRTPDPLGFAISARNAFASRA